MGLVGGGGSILAVPLMVYVVGVPDPHVAIGTSAIAVAANAAFNLSNHARGGTVKWSCALTFAAAGIIGAFAGSIFGKMLDGQKLLALFALVMLVIAALMLKTRARVGLPDVQMNWSNMPAIVGLGLATGTLSGFFGIGGGFLIVPALMLATGMSIMNAVSSSLVAVTAFGLTTAASYAWSGLVSWGLAGLFIAGGIAGGLIGTRSARLVGGAARGAEYRICRCHYRGGALYVGAQLDPHSDRGCVLRHGRETRDEKIDRSGAAVSGTQPARGAWPVRRGRGHARPAARARQRRWRKTTTRMC